MKEVTQCLNIRLVEVAARRLNLPFKFHDENFNFLEITTATGPHFFINCTVPSNSADLVRLSTDKEFTHKLLSPHICFPRTRGYFDPGAHADFDHYKRFASLADIADDISANFSLPLIVKMNAGSQGRQVYKCESERDIHRTLKKIYNKRSKNYDYVALAQEYIAIKKEYRVIILNNQLEFIYEKDTSKATFVGNLSPLHFANAQAVTVEDPSLHQAILAFLSPVLAYLQIGLAGLDVAQTTDGHFVLFEINTQPGFTSFVRDNGEELVIKLYEKMLLSLK
jgi:glutathione synthase/RimK-type ligase-like ATP-grasp enzyme